MLCVTSDSSNLQGCNRAEELVTALQIPRSSAVKLMSVWPIGHLPAESSQSTFRSKARLSALCTLQCRNAQLVVVQNTMKEQKGECAFYFQRTAANDANTQKYLKVYFHFAYTSVSVNKNICMYSESKQRKKNVWGLTANQQFNSSSKLFYSPLPYPSLLLPSLPCVPPTLPPYLGRS